MNTLDDFYAESVSAQRLALAEAVAVYVAAKAQADALAKRVASALLRQNEITVKRLAGHVDPAETAESYVLGRDLEVLHGMLAQAHAKSNSLDPVSQRRQLVNAELEWDTHVKNAQYEALRNRAVEIEGLYLQALRAAFEAGQKVGKRTIKDAVPISAKLSHMVKFNSLPQG